MKKQLVAATLAGVVLAVAVPTTAMAGTRDGTTTGGSLTRLLSGTIRGIIDDNKLPVDLSLVGGPGEAVLTVAIIIDNS